MANKRCLSICQIREGEENDGKLLSTDIYLEDGVFGLLVNVTVNGTVTYHYSDPDNPKFDNQSGTIRKGNDYNENL